MLRIFNSINKMEKDELTETPQVIDDSEYEAPEEEIQQNQKFVDLNEQQDDTVAIETDGGEKPDYSIDYIADRGWDSFKLDQDLIENLISKGFKKPSKIQSNVLSIFFNPNTGDIVGQSQNGSGKTLSFLVPSLCSITQEHVAETAAVEPEVIIIADTKELIYQIFKIVGLIKQKWAKVDYFHKEKSEIRNNNINILISNVGSLSFLIKKKRLRMNKLKFMAIDEADKMVASDSNRNVVPLLFKQLKKTVKIGLFSATLPEKCVQILKTLKRKYTKIVVENKTDLNLKNLNHYYVKCHRGQKLEFIDKFMQKMTKGSVIIFVNSKKFADRFARSLHKKNHKTEILLGDMDIKDRLTILNKFKQGMIRILISTNLIARGIDARKVSLVINLDLPYTYNANARRGEDHRLDFDMETYLHRTGRTARFGDKGIALNVVEDERNEEDILKLKGAYGISMTEVTLDDFQKIISQNIEVNEFNVKKREQNEEDEANI